MGSPVAAVQCESYYPPVITGGGGRGAWSRVRRPPFLTHASGNQPTGITTSTAERRGDFAAPAREAEPLGGKRFPPTLDEIGPASLRNTGHRT